MIFADIRSCWSPNNQTLVSRCSITHWLLRISMKRRQKSAFDVSTSWLLALRSLRRESSRRTKLSLLLRERLHRSPNGLALLSYSSSR